MQFQKCKRQKWAWTKLNLERAANVKQVVNELLDYWPLSLRQIYYRLVAAEFFENILANYKKLSALVTQMRLDEMIPWESMEDRTRRVTDKRGYEDSRAFLNRIATLVENYSRCRVQGQDRYVELWVEKEALLHVFENVTWPYCIRAVICKGFQSTTFLKDFSRRAHKAISQRQTPVILYFGDLDPSGISCLESTVQSLDERFGLKGLCEYKRIALNPEHVSQYDLPHDFSAAKKTDPRYKKYVERFGDIAVELDAVHPKDLQQMARHSIESQFDMDLFEQQMEIEEEELQQMAYLAGQLRQYEL
jgi:hypothetical protein